ncbi:MAG: hypothetical protein ACRC0Y_01400 [Fusobacteriaceae bacterium]
MNTRAGKETDKIILIRILEVLLVKISFFREIFEMIEGVFDMEI